MEGVDIHLDTNVGKQLSSLGYTLTSLTGAEDPQLHVDYDSDENEPIDGTKASQAGQRMPSTRGIIFEIETT